MARGGRLSDTTIRKARGPAVLYDGDGLFLRVGRANAKGECVIGEHFEGTAPLPAVFGVAPASLVSGDILFGNVSKGSGSGLCEPFGGALSPLLTQRVVRYS